MSELLHEIKDDIKSERMAALWKKHGTTIIGCAVAVVLGVSVSAGWSTYTLSQQEASNRAFAEAFALYAEGDFEKAGEGFGYPRSESELTDGYAVVAALMEADALVQVGDLQAALDLYAWLGGRSDVSEELRALAALHVQTLRLNMDGDGDASVAMDDASAFEISVKELQALAALKRGDRDAAVTLYTELVQDEAVPVSLKERAQVVLDRVGGDADAE